MLPCEAELLLFVGIQLAVIARDSMALSQFAYQMARWAAAPNNSATDCTALLSYITSSKNVMPLPVAQIVSANGISCSSSTTPSGVAVTVNCPGAGSCTTRSQGSQVQVVMAMSITNDLFLGQSFLGVGFPSTVPAQSSALTQGG
jgi:hypothetical protein